MKANVTCNTKWMQQSTLKCRCMTCLHYKHLLFGVTHEEEERLTPLRTGTALTQLKRYKAKISNCFHNNNLSIRPSAERQSKSLTLVLWLVSPRTSSAPALGSFPLFFNCSGTQRHSGFFSCFNCPACWRTAGDLQVMNELSRGGRRAKQQREQLCSDKTGEFEAAAPATWRKVSYHSPAVWTRFLVCWNVIQQEADMLEAATIRT